MTDAGRTAARRREGGGVLVFDGIAYAVLLFGYLLLFMLHGRPWPPEGHALLPGGGGLVCAALALVMLAIGTMTLHALQAEWHTATGAGIAALLLLQAGSARALWVLLAETPAARDDYGAVLWAIAAYVLAHLALSALLLVFAGIGLLAGRLHAHRPRALENAVLLSHFTAVILGVGLALLVLFPRLVAVGGT